MRATQRKRDVLGETQKLIEDGKLEASRLETAVLQSEGELAKSQADAQAAVDAANKKAKQALQEEWDAKIADARRALETQQRLLITACQGRDGQLAQVCLRSAFPALSACLCWSAGGGCA